MNIIHGDCIEAMNEMEPESIDAVCTDPPYGLEFMGKEWDKLKPDRSRPDPTGKSVSPFYRPGWGNSKTSASTLDSQAWHQRWAEAAYRVAKPSAYLLAFGGTRTVHRMTVALEDAGWIIRDMLVWAYASGFPKSKASLKPAWEPIVMARKPGPLRMLAIDECRIGTTKDVPASPRVTGGSLYEGGWVPSVTDSEGWNPQSGRWPANVILTDPIFDGGIEGVVGGGDVAGSMPGSFQREMTSRGYKGGGLGQRLAVDHDPVALEKPGYGDSGTYSRFFLIPKADRADREPVVRGSLVARATHQLSEQTISTASNRRCRVCGLVKFGQPHCECPAPQWEESSKRENSHPTVKPIDLMRHLIRLVTPTGGVVLDPFLGSGTTAIAAEMEGFAWIGIEKEAEYVRIAEARLNGTQRGLGLDVGAPIPRMPTTHPDLSKHQPKRRAPGENWSGRWAGTLEEEPA